MLDKLNKLANAIGFTTVDATNPEAAKQRIGVLIGNIIGAVLMFIGVIFIILIIYAGFMWMTARGNEQQIDKAKGIIKTCVVGVIIVAMAYAITQLINSIISGAGLFT